MGKNLPADAGYTELVPDVGKIPYLGAIKPVCCKY